MRIQAVAQGNELVVTVTNSRLLTAGPPASQPGGLGLSTLCERLRLLYPNQEDASLTLAPTTTTFEATLRLPLQPAPARATTLRRQVSLTELDA